MHRRGNMMFQTKSQVLMAAKNGADFAEPLEAQIHLSNHMFSFIKPMSLKCAVELGIPDIIQNHGRPMSLSQLISSLPSIHPSKAHCIRRLMRILVHFGFFSQQKVAENESEEGYALTDASKLLLKDHPVTMAPFFLFVLDPVLMKPWFHLTTWLQSGDPTPFESAHGMAFFEYAGQEPRINGLLNDTMARDTEFATGLITEKYKEVFEGLDSVVDVGGGTGALGKALVKALPQMGCVVFDLPHVVAGLQGNGNLRYVGGDMFESVPPADAVLLKSVLHNWNDEECLKILKNCKEAIKRSGKEGKIIIIEIVMEDAEKRNFESFETQMFMDMQMMVLLAAKQRTEKEWAKLFFSAGFSDYKITGTLGLRSLIEVYP